MGNPKKISSESVANFFIVIYLHIILIPSATGFYFLLGIDFICDHQILTALLTVVVSWGLIFLLYLPYPLGGLIVAALLSALSTYGLYTVLNLYYISDGCLLTVLSILFFLFCFTGGLYAYYAKENMYL